MQTEYGTKLFIGEVADKVIAYNIIPLDVDK